MTCFDTSGEEQVANARPGFVSLAAGGAAAQAVRNRWAAVLPGTDPAPLIWEDPDGRETAEAGRV